MSAAWPEQWPLATWRGGFFWVGGERVRHAEQTFLRGAAYVEWRAGETIRRPYPIVLVHGGGGQGTDFLGTPDGRAGWAWHLLQEGFAVLVVDRPGHGRSPLDPGLDGATAAPLAYETARRMFLASDQWPPDAGHSSLDQFMAAQGPRPGDWAAAQAHERACGVALLERVGPAIVISHSAGGPFGWLMADARPDLVRALVAIEPLGPPFREGQPGGMDLPWGLAAAPLTYDPPAQQAGELSAQAPPGAGRRLSRVARVPIAVVSGERSPLAAAAAEVHAFLERCGCRADHLALGDHGVHGNGHGMIFELNHRDVLRVILEWLDRTLAEDGSCRSSRCGRAA